MGQIVNLTGHHITLLDWNERIVTQFPPVHGHKTAKPALQMEMLPPREDSDQAFNPFQIRDVAISHIKHLHEPLDPEKIYIVGSQTAVVASYLFEHDNVVCPDLGSTAVRNGSGKIIGVRRFFRYVDDVAMPVGGAWAGDASQDS